MTDFARRLAAWHRRHGRHDLPWQTDRSPYRVWVSEVMLQQTQVGTVIPYFERFMRRFPDVAALAAAALDEVLAMWSGLGYYARARNLHRAAQHVVKEHGGSVPGTLAELTALPGIGRSTAGAILSLSRDMRLPILDGNVRRVLARHHGVEGRSGDGKTAKKLWALAESHVPARRAGEYTQAIMDLGATVCTRTAPRCGECPVYGSCQARVLGLQETLPEKRRRPPLPERKTIFAMVQNEAGEILLQRRPENGIWGGLWSFPECPPETDVVDWLESRFGAGVELVSRSPVRRHTFTHFRLRIEPVRLHLRRGPDRVEDHSSARWFDPGDAAGLGLAAPVRNLIEENFPGTVS
jgi:A/G-specific adenine glycosylase